MDPIKLAIFSLWGILALSNVSTFVYWIQAKEYRFDRFRELLKSANGLEQLELDLIFIRVAVLALSYIFDAGFLYLLVLIFLFCGKISQILTKRQRKPILTLRAKEIIATTIAGTVAVMFLFLPSYTNLAHLFLAAETTLLLGPWVGILWTTPLVTRSKKREIEKGRRNLQKINPTVVGITGSYGKTTTKEFAAHLLSQKLKTEKTKANENTDIGIARKAAALQKDTEVFVVEMGAYKRGEIKKATEITKPQVALITGIEPQHLSLFGSLENIRKAKYELIEALPKDGIALFNLTNKDCQELYDKARKEGRIVGGYRVVSAFSKTTGEMVAETKVISSTTERTTFEIKVGGTVKTFTVTLPGIHFLENLSAGILVSRIFKLSWNQIGEGIKTLPVPGKAINKFSYKNATIIDNSYNSTPKAFEAAVNYLKLHKNKKRVVVTSGIIELGNQSESIHHKIGRLLANIDKVYLTNPEFKKPLEEGIGNPTRIETIKNAERIVERIENEMENESAILIEGRMPSTVSQFLQKIKTK